MAILIPALKTRTHPFFIKTIVKNGTYYAAVHYHSRLFIGMTLNDQYLSYKKVPITGLDLLETIPDTFKAGGKNFYCVLEITVSNLTAIKAEIVWVEDDKSVEKLNPVVFESGSNLKQTKARIIIGVCVFDGEETPGTLSTDFGGASTGYVMQFVNTNLMMTNMVFDGIPIIYPVPFGGGRLNF